MKQLSLRTLKLIWGLFLFALGVVLTIQANIGLAPWDAFSVGGSNITGITYGNVVILTGVGILIFIVLLKEKIGLGTILNTVLIGAMSDILLGLKIIPVMDNFFFGLIMLLVGQIVISFGSYFYIGQGLGSGPRDSLMIALSKRLPNVSIGVIRGGIEGTALIIGWLLGAKVGIGTIISVFGIGFIIQYTFKLLRFNVKAVKHDSLFDTAKSFANS
ncbi:YczE/YyaS/YitT family protein [Clostridium intestinale]|uniref:YitT family protein n=1 Tax=Clostridium intestinale URNW TaxID=1294142 RepID=U2NIL5_9CLOT|nr:hypothetical protein [Clostridium intestinale]ERK28983.1 hypothetical protein CINTURNW_3783 [Clostridium intestinale URNW]